MKKIRVRKAKERDLGLFRKLWKPYMEEENGGGNPVQGSDRNVAFYEQLFKKYTSGEWPGCCLFVGEDGVLLWGYGGQRPLDLDWDAARLAHGWGVYVRPESRKNGISRALYEAGREEMRQLGFERVMGEINLNNEAGVRAAEEGGFRPHSVIALMDLSEEQ